MKEAEKTMSNISELVKEAHHNALMHGWHDEERSFGDIISLIHSELSEALEDYRDNVGITKVYFEGEKPCGIPIEFADVIIRIFDACGKYEIDLEEALKLKMEYNKTRPYRHGGKVI
jgi:NTP pyrophosphatase (non-canonical NTP hydrolase)